MIIHPEEIASERQYRVAQERQKALEKYGPDALQPGGRPEFDVLDYLINEVVGLERYGEMIKNRFHNRPLLVQMGSLLIWFSRSASSVLIEEWLTLRRENHSLGERERSEIPPLY